MSYTEKPWEDFKSTGLLLFINQFLHIFGWAIVCETAEDGSFIKAYPARTNFRGFNPVDTDKAYKNLTDYMVATAEELSKDVVE